MNEDGPLRVMMTADTVGSVFTYAVELARALGAQGVEVALCTMGAPLTPEQHVALDALPRVRVHESPFKLLWMSDPGSDLEEAGAWLLEVAAEERPDVVHLNDYGHGALAWPAPVLLAAHADMCSWFAHVRGEAAPSAWDRYRQSVRTALDRAQAVVVPTRAVLDDLVRHYGPVANAHVVPNGRDADRFAPAVTKEPAVLGAGRVWADAQGVEFLVRVAPRLSWPVRIAGPSARPAADGAAVFENVAMLGPLGPAAVTDEMARAAIYALPVRYEPFGLSALEAGLAGCALVLGDVVSLREVWGDAALYVSDTAGLEAALTRLIADASLRVNLAARARRRARRYTPARMVAHYLRLYRTLVAARAAA